ncbi:MAG: ethanolamine ammonia-lyase reactivating factor EutA [Candidatus Thorarchaeota archaeon]|jgi:ethanolamine utilization protein EutA
MSEDRVESIRNYVYHIVSEFFGNHFPENADSMITSFAEAYYKQLEQYVMREESEVEGLRRLIVSFRPALSSVLDLCTEFDALMSMVQMTFKPTWDGAQRRKNMKKEDFYSKKSRLILPGSDPSANLVFLCSVCGEDIEVSYEIKMQILNSDGDVELPQHCGQPSKVKISRTQIDEPIIEEDERDEAYEPIELLMGHVEADNVEYMKILSVGIDVGSSTSHLIFSRLTLKREVSFFNMSNRFVMVDREIIYESPIIFTPLLDRHNIDIEAVVKFCQDEYKKAGLTSEDVDTGAVIVTGETAKKKNADEIVRRLSTESGKFVSAAAGVNLESLLGAMGSGIVTQSGLRQKNILHVDVGGGTSNLAIASMGQVLSTSCINVGGRLLGIDDEFKIWRIDGPTEFLMKELGMSYKIGDIIPEVDARTIAHEYAKALVEVMTGPTKSTIAKELMMADDLDFSIPIDEVSFSGGVAEMIYGGEGKYDDIGIYLAEELWSQIEKQGFTIVEPESKIRATVIGAGSFSLSVSGSTTFHYPDIELPMDNVPVIPVHMRNEEFKEEWFVKEVRRAFTTFDMVEGEDLVALYFKATPHHEDRFRVIAKALEKALPKSVENKKPIIVIFALDFAKMLGISIRDETKIQSNLLCLDELEMEAGDWIDIGSPLKETNAFPVTVKSLVFNEDKKYSTDE